LWLEFAFLQIFHGPYIYITRKKKIEQFFYPHINPSNIIINKKFIENLNPKCDENKYKNHQILKLQNENETKNKNISR
jgi:hypothetical protein